MSNQHVPRVYIVTINHNGDEDTIAFIESLKQSTFTNYALFVVDNSSNPQSDQLLKKYLLQLDPDTYISSEDKVDTNRLKQANTAFVTARNRGFAAANNVVLRQLIQHNAFSEDDYVWIINNDVVIEGSSLQQMITTYEGGLKNNIGIVSPLIYYFNSNKIWFAGGYYYKQLGLLKGFDKNATGLSKVNRNINFLSGCSWLIRLDRVRNLGLLDESYFMYGEDLDYSLKAIELHYTLQVDQKARIWHKIGGSSSGSFSSFSSYWMMYARIRNIKKHNGFFGKISGVGMVLLSRIPLFSYYLFCKRSFIIKSQCKAVKKGLFAR